MPDLIVTLVHGTGATGAPWTQKDALLWQALEERFKDSATIDRFDWSGDNTAFGRLKAGAELAEHVGTRPRL
jgi:hypothetical protein